MGAETGRIALHRTAENNLGGGPGRPPSVGACAVSSAVTLYTAGHMARSASIIGRGTRAQPGAALFSSFYVF